MPGMKILQKKAGFTLIEVIISIAIVSIIAAAFLSAFSNGFINIIRSGQKTEAAEKAQKIIDLIYESGSTDPGVISTYDTWIENKTNYDNLKDSSTYSGESSRYCIENITLLSGITFKKVTVLVYYNNGHSTSIITSYIP